MLKQLLIVRIKNKRISNSLSITQKVTSGVAVTPILLSQIGLEEDATSSSAGLADQISTGPSKLWVSALTRAGEIDPEKDQCAMGFPALKQGLEWLDGWDVLARVPVN